MLRDLLDCRARESRLELRKEFIEINLMIKGGKE